MMGVIWLNAEDLPAGMGAEEAACLVLGEEAQKHILVVYIPTDPPKHGATDATLQALRAMWPASDPQPGKDSSIPDDLKRLAIRCDLRIRRVDGQLETTETTGETRRFADDAEARRLLTARASIADSHRSAELDPPVGVRLPPLH